MYTSLLSDNRNQRIFRWLLIGGLLFFLFQLYKYAITIVSTSVPVEYREGAILIHTDYLFRGMNPYALDSHP